MLTVNPNTHEIVIDRGDDQTVRFTITDSAGNPVDVTGAQFWFTVKNNADEADPGLFQITEGGMVLTQAAQGVVDVPILPVHTSSLGGKYVYDFQMKLAGNVRTLRSGIFRVRKDVTRAA